MVSLLQTLWFVVVRFIARSEITELNTEISLIQTNHSVSNPCKFPKKLGSDDGLSTNVRPAGAWLFYAPQFYRNAAPTVLKTLHDSRQIREIRDTPRFRRIIASLILQRSKKPANPDSDDVPLIADNQFLLTP